MTTPKFPKTVLHIDYDPGNAPLYSAMLSLLEGYSASEAMPALMAAMSHVLVVEADGDRDKLVRDVATAFKVVMKGSIDLREMAEQIRKTGQDPKMTFRHARAKGPKG